MKKLLLSAAVALAAFSSMAQNRILNNTFLDLGAGISYAQPSIRSLSNDGLGLAWSVNAGKWIAPSIGIRVGGWHGRTAFEDANIDNTTCIKADFLWRFVGASYDSAFSISAFGGLGCLTAEGTGKQVRFLGADEGWRLTYALNNLLDFQMEISWVLAPETKVHDGGGRFMLLPCHTLGISFTF